MSNKVIRKFPLKWMDIQHVCMPPDTEILRVDSHSGAPCLLALVDLEAMTEERKIIIHRDGDEIPPTTGKYIGTCDFIGTYVLRDGETSLHVFEAAT